MGLFSSISLLLLCFNIAESSDNRSSGPASNKCNKTEVQYFDTSHCLMCPLNAFLGRCPAGSVKVTTGVGLKKCKLSSGFFGCVHLCKRTIVRTVCCDNYWGPDCMPCPGLELGKKACFGNGWCNTLPQGNGTCLCNKGFEGFACEQCKDKKKFGVNCDKACTCENGRCSSGVLGDGTCLKYSCRTGYHGKNCSIFETGCSGCNGHHSHCVVKNNTAECKCNPGYKRDSSKNCQEIDPCKESNNLCQKNAVCQKSGPGQHKCVCSQGYTGNGVVCAAIDPCQTNKGNCPNNTLCQYLKPGKSTCSCLPGYNSYTAEHGCTIIDLCTLSDCLDPNSKCVMAAPYVKECRCRDGYIIVQNGTGNGTICYGNILQRIDDLHGYGQHKDKFQHVKNIIKRHSDLTLAFTGRGPFTVFLPTDAGLEKTFTSSQLRDIINNKELVYDLILVHSALAYLPMSSLKNDGSLTTVKGWSASVITNSSGPFYQLNDRTEISRITKRDVIASNGILHVIDSPAWFPNFTKYLTTNTSSRTFWDIILQRPELQKFKEYIQAGTWNLQSLFRRSNKAGRTIIAPVNEAFANLSKADEEFLKSPQGEGKLDDIIRNHVIIRKMSVIELAELNFRPLTMAALRYRVLVNNKGVISVGTAKLIENNIPATDGYLNFVDALNIPSYILPIVKNRCDFNDTSAIVYSPCRPCRLKFINGNCPKGSVRTGPIMSCRYRLNYFIGTRIYPGCRAKCTLQVKQCCLGFYGSDCSPCPGPVGHACFGNGKCQDGIKGNGACKCKKNFKGTACELCKDDNKFGLECSKPCTCVHGTCDNGRYGKGSCVKGSCKTGYSGKECAIYLTACGGWSPVLKPCSIHATCYLNGTTPICECKTGYEKIGMNCYEIDPCLQANRGGCHRNAICNKTAPGRSSCVCLVGWTGDGTYCTPINYCATPSRGHCHRNAKCTFIGPARVKCECRTGYRGDGTTCQEINTCLINHGNCSPLAKCIYSSPGKNTCSCGVGYTGDGFTCLASLSQVMKQQPELTSISSLVVKHNLVYHLASSKRNRTIFLPSNAAISSLDSDKRKLLDLPRNLFYFGGSNMASGIHTSTDLKTENKIKSLFPNISINVNHTASGEPLIGGIAKIIRANITASNGIIHIVDKVLLSSLVRKPRKEPDLFQALCVNSEKFKEMCKFIENFELEEVLKNCSVCTIFAPTDEAFHDHPHDKYYNITRRDILYHITRHYLYYRWVLPGQQFESAAGPYYKLSFEKTKIGQILVNGETATYYTRNSTWVIYSIPNVFKAVMNTCFKNFTLLYLRTPCRPCQFSTRRCPGRFRYAGNIDCRYGTLFRNYIGCRPRCEARVTVPTCCPGFWGKECSACPGGNGNPCFGNGKCLDGRRGTGHCNCSERFGGVACERCKPKHYGKDCKKCDCKGNATTCDQTNGFCRCPSNRKGHRCDKIAVTEKCGNGSIVCHQHASCFNETCHCDYGFTGNGTQCTRINLCLNNTVCSPNATCTFTNTDVTEVNCTCKNNYDGDGFYCRGTNLCVKNSSACHAQADCLFLQAGRYSCKCKPGYTGDGENSCAPFNICAQSNGGCNIHANCLFNSTTFNATCTCGPGFTGDGQICILNIVESLQNDLNLTEFYTRLEKSSIMGVLSPENHVSVIAPHNDAFTSSRRKRRSVGSISDADLKYYVVSCVALSEEDTKTAGLSFVTVAGSWLNVTSPMVLNNKVNVKSVKKAGNSAILVVDSLFDSPEFDDSLENMTLVDVAKSKGYGKFLELLTIAKMLDVVSNAYKRPYTMFWPSDAAVSRLAPDIKKRLFDKTYRNELIDVLNYHIVEKTKITTNEILTYSGGLSRRTRQGSLLYISCKGHMGDLFINDRSKIVERDIEYKEGIAFGISEVLFPPGIAGRCDEIKYNKTEGCVACNQDGAVACSPGSILESVDKNASCLFEGQYSGCNARCLKRIKVPKCCKNFYGPDCRACPAIEGQTCGGHGSCDDGILGSGNCSCIKPFIGVSCESCFNADINCGHIVHKICTSRENPCSIFATCDANRKRLCECIPKYEGNGYFCQEIDKCQTNNGGCSKNAVCKYLGPNSAQCQCRSGYFGDGYSCTAFSRSHPCATNNGGCHVYARCTDKDGAAHCRCLKGFFGDGKNCAGSVKDVIYNIEDLSTFAKALRKLSMGQEGNEVIRYLSSEKDYTVFAPIDYGFTLPNMNIHQLKNHIVENKLSFKRGSTTTVLSLAKNTIKVVVSKDGKVRVNNIANMVSSYPSTNGIVVVIDHILPYTKPHPSPKPSPTLKLLLTTAPPTATKYTKPPPSPKSSPTLKLLLTAAPPTATKSYAKVIGIIVGAIAVVVIVLAVICLVKKRRQAPKVKYNRNFESVLFESEAYIEEDRVDDEDYEHQILRHPSTEVEGTTLTNPTYMAPDQDIHGDLLEMTETSSSVPLTHHDAMLPGKNEKC